MAVYFYFLVRAAGTLPASLPGVQRIEPVNGSSRLILSPGASSQEVLRTLIDQNVIIEQFEMAVPTLDEIFIRVVQGEGAQS